jgi:uncharacterized protein YyaL (SSP411 family)
MPNRLAQETSPYLLQHAENPVDWYPWGPEALVRAKQDNKPIFLSIGYSACHWCHVMEHESFENREIADLLNKHFVCIKVDREERPDLDQVYMNAVQIMTGRGGWPMSVFLTPEMKPFYGGTYWPPTSRMGMPGFDQVLRAVIQAWDERRDQALAQAEQLTEYLRQGGAPKEEPAWATSETLDAAATRLERSFDFTHGGFGGAPKFPHPMDLTLLLRVWKRTRRGVLLDMVRLNLERMARGGIYDHLGGGFARYSVDERWLVPHFEKMLYDNALLAGVYLDGFLVTGDADMARVARETCEYVLRDMTDARGGFYSTEDADSEGEEGKFYVWTPHEIETVLGKEAAERFCYVYDVTPAGNFEHGKSILHVPKTIEQCAALKHWDEAELRSELARSRAALLAAREKRVRPGRDDKVLASWNGLMIEALARAAGVLDEPRYVEAAQRAADFLLGTLRRPDGRLLHAWRDGKARFDGCLDDYAYLANALVSLYEADFHERWIDEAVRLADTMMQRFRDPAGGAFFYTADDHEELIARQKDLHDSSVPSSSGMAATALIRLGKLCGRADYLQAARETIDAAAALLAKAPTATGQMLVALDMRQGPLCEIVVLGEPDDADTKAVLAGLRKRFIPNRVVACRPQAEVADGSAELEPIFIGKTTEQPPPTVYVCQNFACSAPVRGKKAALEMWAALAQPVARANEPEA